MTQFDEGDVLRILQIFDKLDCRNKREVSSDSFWYAERNVAMQVSRSNFIHALRKHIELNETFGVNVGAIGHVSHLHVR